MVSEFLSSIGFEVVVTENEVRGTLDDISATFYYQEVSDYVIKRFDMRESGKKRNIKLIKKLCQKEIN
jgi:hypothetical protein